MATVLSIEDFYENTVPFPEYDLGKDAYLPIDEAVNKPITVHAVQTFENDKGEGIYLLVCMDNEFKYICTHSISLCKTFGTEKVREALENGDCIGCVIMRVESRTTKGRMVYKAMAPQ